MQLGLLDPHVGTRDAVYTNARIHNSVYAVYGTNINIASPGWAETAARRYLLVGQTSRSQNGIWYQPAPGGNTPLQRPADWSGANTVHVGDLIPVDYTGITCPSYFVVQIVPSSIAVIRVDVTNIYISPLSDSFSCLGNDVASASTVNLSGTGNVGQLGNYLVVTGTTNITRFIIDTGQFKIVRFTGALTLTHNVNDIILPGSADITTGVGDIACFYCDDISAFRVRCLWYQRAIIAPMNFDINASKITAAATIDANKRVYIPDDFEIGTGSTVELELASGAVLEIG